MRRRPTQDDLENLQRLLKGEHLIDPPRNVLRRAQALGAGLGRRRSVVEWIAERLFDSAAEPLPVGVRGSASAERRLLYELRPASGDDAPRQMDLRLRREIGGTIELTGHLLPTFPGARVNVAAARLRRGAKLNPTGEFMLRGLPAKTGSLRISIDAPGQSPLVVTDVPVPEPERNTP